MNSRSFVAIGDLNKQELLDLLERTRYFEEHPNSRLLDSRVVATLFLNPPHAHALALRQRSIVSEAVS